MDRPAIVNPEPQTLRWWRAVAAWAIGWTVMLALDHRLDISHQALLLVLTAAIAAIWSPRGAAVLASVLAASAFAWFFVPPIGQFAVHMTGDAVLLLTMLAVSGIVSWLMSRQRQLAASERQLAQDAEQLRALGEALREAEDPRVLAPRLHGELADLTGQPAMLLLTAPSARNEGEPMQDQWLGPASEEQRARLREAVALNRAIGHGSGREEDLDARYLPMRGRQQSVGAARLLLSTGSSHSAELLRHAQALCDQMGLAVERADALRREAAARDLAHAQELRSTLLASVSHDHRTPLAIILGAASSLHDQGHRLSAEQRQQLAATIVDEASHLARLTENTLQLARLDTPGVSLHRDWESAEEIVGTVMRRVRGRDPRGRVHAHVEPGLPLLHCDAILLVQLLDNLVDNALKYAGDEGPIDMVARAAEGRLSLAVEDRGPGVAAPFRERIFMSFQRGDTQSFPRSPEESARRGAGVGLAVCRAVARVHDGELRLHARAGGGACFELLLPVVPPPTVADDAAWGTSTT